jgi:hypothetical protein
MTEPEPVIEWVKSDEGFFHLCAFSDSALIMGFPQRTPTMQTTFGALIIRRRPIGVEPDVVALQHNGSGFDVVKSYEILNTSGDLYDWAHQSLLVSLPYIMQNWGEWGIFLDDLMSEALADDICGKMLFWPNGQPETEA